MNGKEPGALYANGTIAYYIVRKFIARPEPRSQDLEITDLEKLEYSNRDKKKKDSLQQYGAKDLMEKTK